MSAPRSGRRGQERAASGPSRREFEALFDDVAPAVYAWARVHILPPLQRRLDPEDVVQEVCIRAFARRETYDAERSPFRSWVFGIAHNVLREALRSLRTRGESVFATRGGASGVGLAGVAEQATSLTSRLSRQEDLQRFLDRIATLAPEERRLLLYRGLEGRRHEEVASLLDVTRETAEKRWQRLCAKLRKRGAPAGLLTP